MGKRMDHILLVSLLWTHWMLGRCAVLLSFTAAENSWIVFGVKVIISHSWFTSYGLIVQLSWSFCRVNELQVCGVACMCEVFTSLLSVNFGQLIECNNEHFEVWKMCCIFQVMVWPDRQVTVSTVVRSEANRTSSLKWVFICSNCSIFCHWAQCSGRLPGPSSWNAFPRQLRDPAISINIFRQSLKTYLFNCV